MFHQCDQSTNASGVRASDISELEKRRIRPQRLYWIGTSLAVISLTWVPLAQAGLTPLTGVTQLWNSGGGLADHSCAIVGNAPGTPYCWGNNNKGQLGIGSTTDQHIAVLVDNGNTDVKAITAGYEQSGIITFFDSPWGMGANAVGQLGDGTTTDRSSPNPTSGGPYTTALATGGYHTCAIVNGGGNTGTVKCWGKNDVGQLGDGSTTNRNAPVAVTGLTTGATALGVGWSHSCAIVSGAAKCWGKNDKGQLGDGSTTNRNAPVAVTGLTSGVTAISAGAEHSCAIVGGAAKCWGSNSNGKLGNGSTTDSNVPVAVTGLTSGVTAISVGSTHSCAIVNGAAKCWGSNSSGTGQLGNNSSSDSNVPVQVIGLTSGVTGIALGMFHSCALLSSGGVNCWGSNGKGQVGNDSTTSTKVPVNVLVYLEAPEIDMEGWEDDIDDGETTPSDMAGTTFYSYVGAPVGSSTDEPDEHPFWILNWGDAELTLTGSPLVTLSGAGCSAFSVTEQPSSPVAIATKVDIGAGMTWDEPGETRFKIAFKAPAVGTYSCTVSIANDDSNENPYDFSIVGEGTDVPLYQLTLETTGEGQGTVTAGNDDFPEYASVTVTATAETGSKFMGWTGDEICTGNSSLLKESAPILSTSNPLTFEMPDTGVTCTARFDIVPTYAVATTTAGTGTGSVTGGKAYAEGDSVTLTAKTDAGSVFVNWSGDAVCTGTSNSLTFTMLASAVTCTATFDAAPVVLPPVVVTPPVVVQPQPTVPKTMDLNVYLSGDGSGRVTTQDGYIDCHKDSRDCVHTYDTGTYVKLTATADEGSTFWAWGGNDDCEDGAVGLNGPRYCTAYFHKITQALTVTKSGNGVGTVVTQPVGIDCGAKCQASFTADVAITLAATAAAGSKFVGFTGDEDCGDGSVKLETVKTCNAVFEILPVTPTPVNYTVTVSVQGNGHVTSTPVGIDCGSVCTATFASGTHVNLTAHADDDSVFANFTGDVGCADGHFDADSNRSCVANFTVPTPPPATQVNPGIAAFVLSNYEIKEGAAILNIAVKRVGGKDGVLTVNYATIDGNIAKAGLDFTGAQGTLTWAEGDVADKTITVTLLDHEEISEEELMEGEEVFYIVLTDAQGVQADKAMVSLLHEPEEEIVTPPTVTPTAPVTPAPVVVESNCPPKDTLSVYCDANGQTIGNLDLVTHPEYKDYVGFLANAVITGTVKLNPGTWISNLDVKEGASVSGGTVTGWIKNAGTLCDFTFRGASIVGGTLCGDIRNISKVGGYFQDVQLAAGVSITGGLLSGQITGDCAEPATLENVRIVKGSHLSCVTLGDGVVLEDNVTVEGLEETPELPALGDTKATNGKGKDVKVKSGLTGGITSLGGKDYQTQATVKVAVDPVDVAGHISVDPDHVEQTADLFIYAIYQETADGAEIYLMRDGNGGIFLWNQNFADLVPFQAQVKLTDKQMVTLYKGVFLGKGLLKLYFGYRLQDGTVVQNGEPLQVTVE